MREMLAYYTCTEYTTANKSALVQGERTLPFGRSKAELLVNVRLVGRKPRKVVSSDLQSKYDPREIYVCVSLHIMLDTRCCVVYFSSKQ